MEGDDGSVEVVGGVEGGWLSVSEEMEEGVSRKSRRETKELSGNG